MTEHDDENWITDDDRDIADAIAEKFDSEPDYEWSATIRRGVQSALMYHEVHGLSFANGQALVTLDDHERHATKNGLLTPVVSAAIAEARRLAWADSDGNTMLDALMASFNAIHEERMKNLHEEEDEEES